MDRLFFSFALVAPLVAQSPVPPASESPVMIPAGDLLDPSLLRGPCHRVRDQATTDGYLATFLVDTDFGTCRATGVPQVARRVREAEAIRRLVETSKSDLFAEGLKRSVQQTIEAVNVIGRLPGATAGNGELHIPAPVDYVTWTPEVAGFATRDDLGAAPKVLVHTGRLSPAAAAGIAAAGWKVLAIPYP